MTKKQKLRKKKENWKDLDAQDLMVLEAVDLGIPCDDEDCFVLAAANATRSAGGRGPADASAP